MLTILQFILKNAYYSHLERIAVEIRSNWLNYQKMTFSAKPLT